MATDKEIEEGRLEGIPSEGSPKAKRASFPQFLRESWAELQKVQWPDRKQVGQATTVVIGFVIIAGSYLGLIDLVASKVVNAII